jgi:hypothetical protein
MRKVRPCLGYTASVVAHPCPSVHPAHIAAALLNEGTGGSVPGGLSSNEKGSLFSSVIQKAGGDPVRIYPIFIHL